MFVLSCEIRCALEISLHHFFPTFIYYFSDPLAHDLKLVLCKLHAYFTYERQLTNRKNRKTITYIGIWFVKVFIFYFLLTKSQYWMLNIYSTHMTSPIFKQTNKASRFHLKVNVHIRKVLARMQIFLDLRKVDPWRTGLR